MFPVPHPTLPDEGAVQVIGGVELDPWLAGEHLQDTPTVRMVRSKGGPGWTLSFTVRCVNCEACVCWLLVSEQRTEPLTWRRASFSRGLQGTTGRSCGRSRGSGLAAVVGQSELAYSGQTGCLLLLWSLLEVVVQLEFLYLSQKYANCPLWW